MNDLFNLNDFRNLDNLLDISLDWNNLWDLNNSLDYLLNDFLNFHNFRYNSENLKDIINTDQTNQLLVNHLKKSSINLKVNSSSLS